MRVLVGMEFSGVVRDAFLDAGHNAISCDLLPSESDRGDHYQGDIRNMLTQPRGYDLIILHPDCTCLTVAGNKHYGVGMPKHHMRVEAAAFTQDLWRQCKKAAPMVCFENPVSVIARMTCLPKARYTHPWMHGHPEQKKTGLHLHNLPALVETDNVYEHMMTLPNNVRQRLHYLPPSPDRWKIRSTTFAGIARAMASQWGNL
jgi:hypothetical protein